ncbi:L,D-transpeptidase family protein [Ramlibacter pallidus]|uniref:Murein L,D-transpeptidase n=1 Tax=Ramlibacter pallidus TaxID=2780087 RepID=A0ABR9S2Y5_9BURK|nr:L,D-transpeptidase [Ramlibacter pallidus]MBE7367868.1 murein L,D-transpeptidase [Ramlibacter pallidus]
MHKNRFVLRALLLAVPLGIAAVPPALMAQEKARSTATQKKAAARPAAVVPTPFPLDATEHAMQLNTDTTMPVLKQGDKGPAVIRAQVMLDRNWFSVGEIDGSFGSNMKRALSAFQQARGLPVTGTVDEATWGALSQGQAPVFATYQLTQEDVNGPFVTIAADDPVQQSQLPTLGYQNMGEAIGERFHMSPKLLAALNQGRDLQPGQAIVVPDVGRAATLATATVLRIDKSDKMLYIIGEGDKVMGAVPVSIGSSQDPLPLGELKTVSEVKFPDYSYNPALLRNPKADQKLKLPKGPNSPVGIMWLGLTKEHWGIHGTSEPSQMAKVETNGCVRLTNWDVLRLSTITEPGVRVEVQA